MFYKFMGGTDAELLVVFDHAVVNGSLKFSSAARFNDPFEFKFRSVVPERDAYEQWHRLYARGVSVEQRENGWEALTGRQKDWNTGLVPRLAMLEHLYVLCLAQRWDIHLMWSHYTSGHRGFAIRYKPEIGTALESLPDFETRGNVRYSDVVPDLRWFSRPPAQIMPPVLLTKSSDWAYEAEHRVVLTGAPGKDALFHSVPPDLVAGVIFGARVPWRYARPARISRSKRWAPHATAISWLPTASRTIRGGCAGFSKADISASVRASAGNDRNQRGCRGIHPQYWRQRFGQHERTSA